ncbi:MAG: hypothetical protein OES09_12335 [Gammaproteobacteria bacterium]|nr:hypothetical protein [Gammaproteobacteria bacterium]
MEFRTRAQAYVYGRLAMMGSAVNLKTTPNTSAKVDRQAHQGDSG